MRRTLIACCLAVPLFAARADAVTLKDLIELSRAGLSDDVLIALIQVDRTVFPIDVATMKRLRDAGVSDAVVIAMIRSGREREPGPTAPVSRAPAPEPEPQIVYVDRTLEPLTREAAVPLAFPVYVVVGVAPHPPRTGPRSLPAVSAAAPGGVGDLPPMPDLMDWGFWGKRRGDAPKNPR